MTLRPPFSSSGMDLAISALKKKPLSGGAIKGLIIKQLTEFKRLD